MFQILNIAQPHDHSYVFYSHIHVVDTIYDTLNVFSNSDIPKNKHTEEHTLQHAGWRNGHTIKTWLMRIEHYKMIRIIIDTI